MGGKGGFDLGEDGRGYPGGNLLLPVKRLLRRYQSLPSQTGRLAMTNIHFASHCGFDYARLNGTGRVSLDRKSANGSPLGTKRGMNFTPVGVKERGD